MSRKRSFLDTDFGSLLTAAADNVYIVGETTVASFTRPPKRRVIDDDSLFRSKLAQQNKVIFEQIRQEAMQDPDVLQMFKNYDAKSHKDKIADARHVADLRVSYFHYNSRAFQLFLITIWDDVIEHKRLKALRRKWINLAMNDGADASQVLLVTATTAPVFGR